MKNLFKIALLLVFMTTAKFSIAQTVFYGVISNTTGCTIQVDIYDNSSNLLYSNSVGTGPTNISCGTSGVPYYVEFTYNSCTIRLYCGGNQQNVPATCGSCTNLNSYDVGCFTDYYCGTIQNQITININ